jgi:Mrp family chromosome partitioning ATPase
MARAGIEAGIVCTFYSYKGGVGRSMAVANVAALLAQWGRKVLVVDWDLEAPGLDRYFQKFISGSGRRSDGIVDLFEAFAHGETRDWRRGLVSVKIPKA